MDWTESTCELMVLVALLVNNVCCLVEREQTTWIMGV